MPNILGISDEAWTKLQNGAREVQASLAANGTVNGKTGNQNLAAVIQQPGNTTTTKATPYINAAGQTDYHITGQPDTGAPTPPPVSTPATSAPTFTPPSGPVDSTPMKQAMASFVPPTAKGLTFDQAKSQVSGQIDPMFARALEALQAQKYQDQLNGDQLGMARGGAHSGLAADLQNKVGIAAAGKASDLDATRQTQIAEMAQALVNRGEDNDFRNKQQALAEYLGLNQLDLQRQGQTADYTGMFGGQQTMQSKNADRGYGLDLAGLTGQLPGGGQTMQAQQQSADNAYRDKAFNYNVAIDSRDFDYKKAQDSWNQTFQKEQYNDQKAAQLWEQTFKTKSFEQDMKDAAASRGLQWASLSQRDKEFVADSAYREKTYEADQTQRGIDNTFRSDQAKAEADAKLLPPKPSDSEIKNNSFAEYTAAMDSLTPAERKKAIAEEKNNLIKEFGPTGYNQFYDLYFDKYGNPK